MRTNRSKLKFFVGILIVFFLGVAAGGLGASLYFKLRIAEIFERGPRIRVDGIMERLTDELNLSPIQQQEIRAIFEAGRKKAFELERQFRPQMEAIHEQTVAQIQTRLNEEQQRKFSEINRRLKERFGRRPPPPPSYEGPPPQRPPH